MSDIKQYTPGPYHIEKRTTPGEFGTDTLIVAEDDSVLATIRPCNIEANAPLFAAAPNMFKQLKELVRLMNVALGAEENPFGIDHNDATDAVSAAEVIINQITGGK